jgi:3'-phosphoadenosine 5'-phosphosulfate sulfotransferase (PAPS reductase)/FAD synthetase
MIYTSEDLKQMQSWSLDRKIQVTQTRIIEFYQHYEGKVYVSFSGGKDSTVLLNIARKIYPDIEAVFVDTGLEYPEIREFVKGYENVTWLKPKMRFDEVIEKYGYPVISKENAQVIYSARRNINGSRANKLNGLLKDKNGNKSIYNLEHYKYLLDAPFKISDHCCEIMKKRPFKAYQKTNNKYPIIGVMAGEGKRRQTSYLKTGCNSFNNNSMSRPMGFWTEQDVFQYLDRYQLPIAKVYGDLIKTQTGYCLTGVKRTGCMFCMFGVHLEDSPNRFERMKETHPKQWEYCMKNLKMQEVLDFIGVSSEDKQTNMFKEKEYV